MARKTIPCGKRATPAPIPKAKILTNDACKEDPEFVKCSFEGIVSNRIDEENEQKEQTLCEFELQKIRLQNETQRVVSPQSLSQAKIELKKLLPAFNPEVNSMDLFLTLFERQMKLLNLGEDLWVPYLIGVLPSDVTSPIDRETEEKCRDYSHIRGMLLQRFKLTAGKFRELFSRHRKSRNGTEKDYYFEIRTYILKGRVCAVTGSSHSIAEERMHQVFKDSGLLFQETTLAMSLVNGQQTTGETLTTQVMVGIEGKSVLAKFIILPKAKRNRTLLGADFLSSAGLILDVKNACWYFWDNPTRKYPFGEELDTPSIAEKMFSNTCQLREREGESLTSVSRRRILTSCWNPSKMSPNQGEKEQLSLSTTSLL
ncbi:uncharacterized protein TNCV_1152641 [Trichonephila clavipes]|nr:uncharacterized protein TNCV_1152641 [Trichonephila clavipes]